MYVKTCPFLYLCEVLSVTELSKIKEQTINLPIGVPIPRKQNSAPLLILESENTYYLSALPSA